MRARSLPLDLLSPELAAATKVEPEDLPRSTLLRLLHDYDRRLAQMQDKVDFERKHDLVDYNKLKGKSMPTEQTATGTALAAGMERHRLMLTLPSYNDVFKNIVSTDPSLANLEVLRESLRMVFALNHFASSKDFAKNARAETITKARPKWTVLYNIVTPGSDWVGTGWEFCQDEAAAQARFDYHIEIGNCPTKRPYDHACDWKHLGAAHRM